ncbi:hypothetical protein TNCT_74591 [Trichonephila clavata]|uniref:Uncharacterized protein n=1 Tax=Trichonephila clavata TaxID=2740835 RepID=A0A8X6LV12_TRICU|nr:hypothetical protein TNCT_74591 [Trichonephila clavata]
MIPRFLNGKTNWALKSQCGICAPPEELLILQMTVTIPFVCGRRKYALSVCVCMREWPQHIWVMRSSSLPLHFPSLLENDWCVIIDSPPPPLTRESFVGLF